MKKRLFVAVDISEEVRIAVKQHIDRLREKFPEIRIGWTKPENIHLTLKFLGSVDETQISDISTSINAALIGVSEFYLEITDTGVFPPRGKAKVLWLGVKDKSDRLALAAQRIDKSLVTFGFPKEDRGFSPHLTIGRSRSDTIPRELENTHRDKHFEPQRFSVDHAVLYESKLTPSGPIYSAIRTFRLRGGRQD